MSAKQRGVAIVLAMAVVALAAMAATAMMLAQSTWSRESELTADHVQAQATIAAPTASIISANPGRCACRRCRLKTANSPVTSRTSRDCSISIIW
jgi:hypothetical protein